MRKDFKEERKWKVYMAYKLAYAVKEWHSVQDKSHLVVNVSFFLKKCETFLLDNFY
jgi:hypothetical protein